MAQSNAQNQNDYKRRMRAAGYRRAEAWIHPDDAPLLRRVAAMLREHRETGNPFSMTIERKEGPGASIPVETAEPTAPAKQML